MKYNLSQAIAIQQEIWFKQHILDITIWEELEVINLLPFYFGQKNLFVAIIGKPSGNYYV